MADLGPVGELRAQRLLMPLPRERTPNDWRAVDRYLRWTFVLPVTLLSRDRWAHGWRAIDVTDLGGLASVYLEQEIPVTGQVCHPRPEAVGVIIYGWNTRRLFARLRLDAEGRWSAPLPPGRYGITYQADGAQPITHGPYQV